MNIPKNTPLRFNIEESLLHGNTSSGKDLGPVRVKYKTTGFYDGHILTMIIPRHPEENTDDVWDGGSIMMPMRDKDGEYFIRIDGIDRKVEIMSFD